MQSLKPSCSASAALPALAHPAKPQGQTLGQSRRTEDDFWGSLQALLVGEVEVVPLEVAWGDGVAPAPRRAPRRGWGQHS